MNLYTSLQMQSPLLNIASFYGLVIRLLRDNSRGRASLRCLDSGGYKLNSTLLFNVPQVLTELRKTALSCMHSRNMNLRAT